MNRADLERNLATVERFLEEASHRRTRKPLTNDEEYLVNTMEFTVVFNGDLSACLYAIERAKTDWERRFMSRVLSLLLLEASVKLKSFLGKRLRSVFRKFGTAYHFEELGRLHADVCERTDRFAREFGALRDNAIGHRDSSASTQLRLIRALDMRRIEDQGWQFVAWLNQTYALLSDFSSHASGGGNDTAA